MDEVTVLVEADINPTETEGKVKTAIANLFGSIPSIIAASDAGSVISAETAGLTALAGFRDLLRRERVRAAARKVLFKGLGENTLAFYLNKQAAFANHVSFSQEVGESPLGPIKVTIKCQNPSELVDWLAPRTP
jgi:hypothetical protein